MGTVKRISGVPWNISREEIIQFDMAAAQIFKRNTRAVSSLILEREYLSMYQALCKRNIFAVDQYSMLMLLAQYTDAEIREMVKERFVWIL